MLYITNWVRSTKLFYYTWQRCKRHTNKHKERKRRLLTMYRSDKQFMKNPATASSRIYIGNLLEQVTSVDLEDRFKCYGTVLGLVLQRGFGFIQFENDSQAQAAIRSEHNALFFGRKLNVRQAVDKTRLNTNQQQTDPQNARNEGNRQLQGKQDIRPQNVRMDSPPPPPSAQLQQQRPKPLMQTIVPPPKVDQQPEVMEITDDDVEIIPEKKESEVDPPIKGRLSDVSSDTSDRKRPGGANRQVGGMNRNRRDREHDRFSNDDFPMREITPRDVGPREIRDLPPRDVRDLPPRDVRDLPPRDVRDLPPRDVRDLPPRDVRDLPPRDVRDLPPRDMRDLPPRDIRDLPPRDALPYYGREDVFRPPPFIPPPGDRPERNDCEIIVVSRLLTEYAEYIEQRLKTVGLMVDLLYPNEDVPIGRVLANISSRGCLYAILVMPQNEEYRSLTLSILHGIPQEHRNMPIEDAITLITRNFDAYMRGEKSSSPGTGNSLIERHPESIQMVFNLLAENRQITSNQYDRILKYLQDRRELQRQFEVTEGGGDNENELQPNSKQAELQSRIMNILNKTTDDIPKPVDPPHAPSGPTPLLNDPTVQKALDSLLSGDMFKSIASGL